MSDGTSGDHLGRRPRQGAARGYRDYIDPKWRDAFDDWLKSFEGMPDGFVRAEFGEDAQWDPKRRVADMETQGVMTEILFGNGAPFAAGRVDYAPDPEQTRQANMAFNRWVIDFCSEAPDRLHGQALVSFDDVDQAVKDVHWAKEQGLVGILMPPLYPGSKFFFDPALDPIWAACTEVGLPLSQHGGIGAPDYQPQIYAAFMVLAAEHSFFSGRSLWQLILGGVFDRFPELKIAFIETEAWWIAPMMRPARRARAHGRRLDRVRRVAAPGQAVLPDAERVLADELLRGHLAVPSVAGGGR